MIEASISISPLSFKTEPHPLFEWLEKTDRIEIEIEIDGLDG